MLSPTCSASSLLYDIDFNQQDADEEYRNELEAYAIEFGNDALHRKLKEIDPVSAEKIHANNVKRVIRALEYFKLTGKPISEHNEAESEKESPYNFAYFVLNDHRELLYARIEKRIDEMLEEGLVDEVKHLLEMGCKREATAMQGLGYKEIISYLLDEITLDEAVYLIKRDTRHFAKRQLTWFRRERDVIWVEKDKFAYDDQKMLEYMIECFGEKTEK